MSNKYLKSYRLRETRDFKYMKRMGCKYDTPHFVLLITDKNLFFPRLGISVSRKVGNAVIRNRIKRLIREFFRNNIVFFKNIDCLFIARKNANFLNTADLNKELNFFFNKFKTY